MGAVVRGGTRSPRTSARLPRKRPGRLTSGLGSASDPVTHCEFYYIPECLTCSYPELSGRKHFKGDFIYPVDPQIRTFYTSSRVKFKVKAVIKTLNSSF